MARIVKPEFSHHALRVRCDTRDGELLISGHGKTAYLWVGKDERGATITTYSGRIALRKLAKQILKCVGNS